MSLRGRLTLWPAAIAALVAVLTAGAAYAVVRHELRERVDDRLAADALAARERPGAGAGVVVVSPDGVRVPVTARDRDVAAHRVAKFMADRTVAGVHVRTLTRTLPGRRAVLAARSLEDADTTLEHLRAALAIACAAGALLALALARVLARRTVRPLDELAATAAHIRATGGLSRRGAPPPADQNGPLAAPLH